MLSIKLAPDSIDKSFVGGSVVGGEVARLNLR